MLTSLQNPLVKQLRKLHRTKERHRQGVFLLEGTHLLEEAIAVNYPLQVLCCTPDWQSHAPSLWQQVNQKDIRVEIVSPEVLAAIATTVNPDGVIATAPLPTSSTNTHPKTLAVILESLQDPGNLGTIIRTGAATSIDGLWLSSSSVEPTNPKVLRASAGQWFRLPMQICSDLTEWVQIHQRQGIQAIATVPDASLTYWDIDLTRPTLLLMGNEGAGLSKELLALADYQVQIPLAPNVESLNVAIATALILYEARRQRRSFQGPVVSG